LLRRQSGRADPLITHGDLTLNPATHQATWRGEDIALSGREFVVLQALLERPGAVLSRAQLEEQLYGWDEEVASNAVEVHIHHLRRKLGPELIRNVRGVGYMVPKLA
jgi:DNA-binding response OmpR family regulator